MIDKTKWGIIRCGVYTASGRDEILVRFVLKKDCVWTLKQRYGGVAKASRQGLKIEKLT